MENAVFIPVCTAQRTHKIIIITTMMMMTKMWWHSWSSATSLRHHACLFQKTVTRIVPSASVLISSSIFICIPSLSCPWNKMDFFQVRITISSFVYSIRTLRRPITYYIPSGVIFFLLLLLLTFYIFLKFQKNYEESARTSYDYDHIHCHHIMTIIIRSFYLRKFFQWT